MADLQIWQSLMTPPFAPLRAEADECDTKDLKSVARLRKKWPLEHVHVALQLADARKKLIRKFPIEVANRLIADPEGVEQATHYRVADHKAQRFKQFLPLGEIGDLCCGIGGDALALTKVGIRTLAVDRDPVRAWMTEQNAQCQVLVQDVIKVAHPLLAIHIDPARRSNGKRIRELKDYEPSPQIISGLIEQYPNAAIKLSPGIDLTAIPWNGEIEFISLDGNLVEATLWTGDLARSHRQCTLIQEERIHSLTGSPEESPLGPARNYLYTFDASIERAGLISQLCERLPAHLIHPSLGLLSSDKMLESPWIRGFELLEIQAYRQDRLKRWLRENDGGQVEIKTRGKAVDPDRITRELNGRGGTRYTIFILRWDKQIKTFVTKRL